MDLNQLFYQIQALRDEYTKDGETISNRLEEQKYLENDIMETEENINRIKEDIEQIKR